MIFISQYLRRRRSFPRKSASAVLDELRKRICFDSKVNWSTVASCVILVCLLMHSGGSGRIHAAQPVDETKVQAAGIRKLESTRLTLYTDLPSSPEVDELPRVFDQAFDLWCKYFNIDPAQHKNWHMRASLMDVPARFEAAGLLAPGVPKFFNGYTRDHECWLNNQTSPYYRRHLLLHEGVHGIMFTLLGDNAPPWYTEGMAELLATHRWQNGRLELPYFPKRTDEVPKLNRIEIVQTDFANHRAKQLTDVMAYDNRAHLQVEPYAWSWAAAVFLDEHPRYRDRFRKLISLLKGADDFNAKLWEAFAGDAPQLAEDWQVFVADLDYGYDFQCTAIDFTPGKPLQTATINVDVQADHGWQNSGLRLEAGKSYKITASGRYQVASPKKPWISEPNGVSIRYINGKPLGILLAAVHQENPTARANAFLKPIVVGYGTTITPEVTGTLYLKINDSAGQLDDNAGHAQVTIAPE